MLHCMSQEVAHRDEPNLLGRINFTSAFRGTAETISRTANLICDVNLTGISSK
jgi:hypothetical protein